LIRTWHSSILLPLPWHTALRLGSAKKRLLTQDWWEYELGGTILELGSISNTKLLEVYNQAFKTYYNRPIMYLRRLQKIRSFRHLKDAIDAFIQIMIKANFGKRGNYQREWLTHKCEDYFDLDFCNAKKNTDKIFSTLVIKNKKEAISR